jgi:PPOX class probable F420-dependent enzyme
VTTRTLADFATVAGGDNNYCVIATTRGDGTVQASVVSAGVMRHPAGDADTVVCVARGGTRKLANLRTRAATTIVASNGGAWITVEGRAELIGPDDVHPGIDQDQLPELLRAAFRAAGGTHDDWDAYDRVMAEERRTAVLVTPTRVYGNHT